MEVLVIKTLDAFKKKGLAQVLLECVNVASQEICCELAFVHVHRSEDKGGFKYFSNKKIGYNPERSKEGNEIVEKDPHAGGTYGGFCQCRLELTP